MSESNQSRDGRAYHAVIPIHFQIQRVLRANIESGKWAFGERLPSEFELMRRFDVSRTTIRSALQSLENDGLITRQRRHGTFVAKQINPQQHGSSIKSLLLGYSAEVRLLASEEVPVPSHIAPLLDLERDEPVHKFTRLEIVDERPLALVINYLPLKIARRIDDREFQRFSLLEILRDRLSLDLAPMQQSVGAALPDEIVARHLDTDVSAPVLTVRLVVRSTGNEAVQVCEAYYRGDTYRYETEVALPAKGHADAEGIIDLRPRKEQPDREPPAPARRRRAAPGTSAR